MAQSEEDDDFDLDVEMHEGIVITDLKRGGYKFGLSGYFDTADTWEEILVAVLQYMEQEKYYPNVFYVNERGNTDLLEIVPKTKNRKIVGASSKIIQSWV